MQAAGTSSIKITYSLHIPPLDQTFPFYIKIHLCFSLQFVWFLLRDNAITNASCKSPVLPSHTIQFKYHSVIYNCSNLIRKDACIQLLHWILLLSTLYVSFEIICILYILSRYQKALLLFCHVVFLQCAIAQGKIWCESGNAQPPKSAASSTGWTKYVTGERLSAGLSLQLFYPLKYWLEKMSFW